MRQYLRQFMADHCWKQEAADAILQYYDSFISRENCKEALQGWVRHYQEEIHLDYSLANREIAREAQNNGLGGYEAQLLLYLCFSRYLPQHYAQAGLPEHICMSSLEDLKWKAIECNRIYGAWGSFVADWFSGFFNMSRFTLGRLQYEAVPFPEDYPVSGRLSREKVGVVLNTHIPSAGPLDPDSCRASYTMAADFWERYFHAVSPAIYCYSWLLYPAHEEFLPRNSNILKFQRDFEVYKEWQDNSGSDLWRIFDCMYEGSPEKLPEDTSLRRAYKEWLAAGKLPGGGMGFLREGVC